MASSASTEPRTGNYRWTGRMAAMLFAATSITGCISPSPRADGTYTTPIGGAPVINNETQYSNQLRCIGGQIRSQPTPPRRIAVGNIADYTGKYEADGSGRKVTQGANLMDGRTCLLCPYSLTKGARQLEWSWPIFQFSGFPDFRFSVRRCPDG